MSTTPSWCWGFVRFEPVQVLCALSVSELICMLVLLCLEDAASLSLSTTSGSYSLSVSSASAQISDLEDRDLIMISHLEMSVPKSVTLQL